VILIDHGRKLLDTTLPELQRDYTRFKTLRLATTEAAPRYSREGVTTTEQAAHRLTLNVDISVVALEQVVVECLAAFSLQDIAIEGMPLEEIIKTIYAQRRPAS
jgi:ABC-type uncharacterized transport system ATPase subunit